jgi:predicted ribosome quality control (RQC) complex YloA/Tae2 family protein
MPADYRALAEEIGRRAGDRVRAAHQDGPDRFRLALEGKGGRADLVLHLDPDLPRLHLADPEPAPRAPSPLAATLRNALAGARLEGAEAVVGERAIALRFSLAGLSRTLWFEGFGRQANLYLLDEAGVVLATPRGEVAKTRGASVGAAFVPSPPRLDERSERVTTEGTTAPSEEISRAAAADEAAREFERRRSALLRDLARESARAAARVTLLEKQAADETEVETWRRRGDLLRASFPRIEPGAGSLRVVDDSRDPPEEVEIPLDPALSPGAQIGRCFAQAERAKRRVAHARATLPTAREEAGELTRLAAVALGAGTAEDIDRIRAAAGLAPLRSPTAPRGPSEAKPWREYLSRDGWTILVGKDAAGNDRLTTRESAPHDLFLHLRGGSGSHVIVRTPRGKTVPKETLLDAAELACFHSSRRSADRNEVDYAERRFVRKPRGAPPGLVALERAKTLSVRRDDDRRRRLLGREGGPSGGE